MLAGQRSCQRGRPYSTADTGPRRTKPTCPKRLWASRSWPVKGQACPCRPGKGRRGLTLRRLVQLAVVAESKGSVPVRVLLVAKLPPCRPCRDAAKTRTSCSRALAPLQGTESLLAVRGPLKSFRACELGPSVPPVLLRTTFLATVRITDPVTPLGARPRRSSAFRLTVADRPA